MARRPKVETGSLNRVLPYVWPHRRKVLLSFVFAALVAVLWGMNLSVAFPVVKILLEGQSLTQYVTTEIDAAERERTEKSAQLARTEARIAAEEARPPGERDRDRLVKLYKEQASAQARITEASRT
ncbi:MAG TPA: hypothetical protein VF170_14325, partial [Planctomycetaceae bacterium]